MFGRILVYCGYKVVVGKWKDDMFVVVGEVMCVFFEIICL